MSEVVARQLDLLLLEDTLWVLVGKVDLPSYDFDLTTFFACRRPWQRPDPIRAIGRFGVMTNYAELYERLAAEGILLIHTPAQYRIASELPQWYPLLDGLTPYSEWFAEPPDAAQLERKFGFPFFLKGSRQTSRHRAALSIIHSTAEYNRAIGLYRTDPILHWQELVCRKFFPLRAVPAAATEKIPPSFEFRTFWWRGQFVGAGQYWATDYDWTRTEEIAALNIARTAAARLILPFVAIDVAQTIDGEWIVIECNDAQESGYGAVSPFGLWQNMLRIERELIDS
jgi:ATP-grasp domain, R2K clade family 3